jgi:hypothetical protein
LPSGERYILATDVQQLYRQGHGAMNAVRGCAAAVALTPAFEECAALLQQGSGLDITEFNVRSSCVLMAKVSSFGADARLARTGFKPAHVFTKGLLLMWRHQCDDRLHGWCCWGCMHASRAASLS